MSLDSLLRLVTNSVSPASLQREAEDMAFAEVAASGTITSINPFGRLSWGWRVGSPIATDLKIALETLQSDEPVQLPVTRGGLHIQGMARSDGEGWFLIGHEPENEQGVRDHFSFRALMEHIPQPALCLNAHGLAWYVNESTGRVLGEAPAALLGRPVLSEMIDPEDRWKLAELLELAARDGSSHASVRYGVDRKVGVLHIVGAVRDEFQAIILTVPDEDDFINGSHIQESFYQSFLEQGPIGVLYLDAQGRVTFENHCFRTIVGADPEASWLGLFVKEIPVLPEDVASDFIELCREGTPLTRVADLIDPETGDVRHILNLHASAIRHPDGRILGAAVLIEDRTERERQERELSRIARIEHIEHALRELATSHPDPDAFRNQVVRTLGRETGADRVSVLGVSTAQDRLVAISDWSDRDAARVSMSLPMSERDEIARALGREWKMGDVFVQPFDDNGRFAGYLVAGWSGDTRDARRPDDEALNAVGIVFESLYSSLMLGARYRTTVAAIDDALFSFSLTPDRQRRYHFLTDQITMLTGRGPESLRASSGSGGDWITTVVHPEDRSLVRAHDLTLTEGHESRVTYRVMHTDGSICWLREHATPRTDATGMTAAEGILSDVTEQKAAELVLLQAKKEAEASNRSKTAFIATMSHEIRTPLGAVNGFAQLLEREMEEVEEELGEDLPEQIHEFTRAISERSRKLLALVQDLFELSNLEMGQTAIIERPVSVTDALRRGVDRVRTDMDNKGIRLDLALPDEEVVVSADARRIDQILDNMLSNAVKFTDAGEVRVRLSTEDNDAVLELQDTGIGISEDYLENLFDAFSQEEDWRNRRFEGTGLGLALVRRLLEIMGGSIEVESEKHVGSTFLIRMPLFAEDVSLSEDRNSSAPPLERDSIQAKRAQADATHVDLRDEREDRDSFRASMPRWTDAHFPERTERSA